ncbi:hypothetical protein H4I95_01023 [Botrytis cinerea]
MSSTIVAGTPAPAVCPNFGDSLGLEIVTLIVGPKRKEFAVHKKLICDSCDYFNKAFCGPFLEGAEGKIYLPEDSSDAVALFIEWLYRQVVNYIWDQTEDKSPLRLLCIKRLAWFYHDETTPNIIPGRDRLKQLWLVCKEHSSFFEDFFAYFQNFTEDNKPPNPGLLIDKGRWAAEICSYHRDEKGEGCTKPTEVYKDKHQNGERQRHEFFADLQE